MPINWSGIDMPQFNYRLRRAVDPFSTSNLSRKYGSTQFDAIQPEEKQDSFDSQIPDFSKFRDKTGPSMDAYKKHLGNVPSVEDYAPTKWRRAGAILSGVNAALSGKDGYSTARDINLDPYKQAYSRWDEQGQGLGATATLESNDSARQATFYQKVMSDYMDQARWNEDRKVRQGTLENQRDQTGIQQQRAEIEAERVAGQISNAEAANRIRTLGINTAAGTARRGQDINAATQKYGIETRRYDAQKSRDLQRELDNPTGAIQGGSQASIQQSAMDAMVPLLTAQGYDLKDYFVLDVNGMPLGIKATLPNDYFKQKYQDALNQGYSTARGRR